MGNKRTKGIDWKGLVVDSLYLRDMGICQLCGKGISNDDLFEIDHIIEQSDGGTHSLQNLRIVHMVCHKNRHGKRRTNLPLIPESEKVKPINDIKKIAHVEILERLRVALRHEDTLVGACRILNITIDQAKYYLSIYKLNWKDADYWKLSTL